LLANSNTHPARYTLRMTQFSRSSIHILQITDLHLKGDPSALWRGFNVQNSLDAVLQLASEHSQWPPDAILVTGDIVDDETPEGYRQSYRRLAEQLREQLGKKSSGTTRIGFIPGNHDNAEILQQSCSQLSIESCGAFTLNNWQIIQLDSSLPDSDDGELGTDQLQLLDTALQNSTSAHSLIVLHHPLVKLKSEWMDSMRVKDADALFKRIDRYNEGLRQVRAITWGHAHQQTELLHQQVRLFGTPAAGPVQFTAGSNDFAIDNKLQAGLRWLTLNVDGSIETSVHRLPSPTNNSEH